MRRKELGAAIAPDGRPADLIVEEDGTTFLRVEGQGLRAWVNLDKLRDPFDAGPISFPEPEPARVKWPTSWRPPVADYMWLSSVVPGLVGTGYTFEAMA